MSSVYTIPDVIKNKASEIERAGITIFKNSYYSLLDYDEEYGLTMNVYAIAFKKNWKAAKIKLAFTIQEKRWVINSDMYYTKMGGWNILWEMQKKYSWYSYYGPCSPTDELYEREYDKNSQPPNVQVEGLWDYKDLISLIPEAKYLTEYPPYEIVKFISIWRDHPQIEVIYKNPVTRKLWSDTRLWNLSKEKQKEVLPLLLKGYSLNDALGLAKYKNAEKMNKAREKQRIIRNIAKKVQPYKEARGKRVRYHLTSNQKLEIYKYIESNKIDTYDYNDYLNLCLKLKRNLKSHGVMFPKDFTERHDALVELSNILDAKKINKVNSKRNKAYIKVVQEITSKLSNIKFDSGKFDLKIPQDMQELLNIGNELEICVGSSDYDIKVANHESIILVFYIGNRPIECCELKRREKKLELWQLRGYKNQNSEHHDECLSLINNYIPMAQAIL